MTPIDVPHAGTVKELNGVFSELAGARAVLSVQDPVVLDEFSEPQPDFMLLKPPRATYRRRHPHPDDVLLLVEVADSSGPFDRNVKVPLYAGAGILEYWIVDVSGGLVEVYRSPSGDRCGSVEKLTPGQEARVLALSDIKLSVSAILGLEEPEVANDG